MIDTLLLLAAALSFVFGWNNSSFVVGNMAGSGTVSLKAAASLTALGMLSGVILEGPKMLQSLNGSLASSVPSDGVEVAFGLSLIIILTLTLAKLPAPLSGAMVGAFLGVAAGLKAPTNLLQAGTVISFWFVAPLITALGAYGLRKGTSRLVAKLSLAGADSFNRAGVLAGSFAVSYTLGANNLGMIVGTALGGSPAQNASLASVVMALLAVVGVLVFGRGRVSGTVGDRLLSLRPQGVLAVFGSSALVVWLGTQLAIPVSISQCVLGGMLGAALSQRTALLNARVAYQALSTWVAVPVVAFLIGYAVTVA
ncbi:MAG: inorganic phosphate transporter [Nitrososphaerales archaeon]|nr:inorganic phosphate transporter [Nitrososphaerales archaeon]